MAPEQAWPIYLVVATIVVVAVAGSIGAFLLRRKEIELSHQRRTPQSQPRRGPVRPATPVKATFAGGPVPHLPAVVLASVQAAVDGQPVDRVSYGRDFPGDERHDDWDADDYRSELNGSLGPAAHTVGHSLTLLQEVLAQRSLVGPELWQHQLEDRMTQWGLPLAERAHANHYVEQIVKFERRMVDEGLLREGEQVTTVAPIHWANAIRTLRIGQRAGVLDAAVVERWLTAADQLVLDTFGPDLGASVGVLFAGQLLPVHLFSDDSDFERRLRLVKEMLPGWRARLG